ncbi:unnamed protein product [Arabis nemorensis]|uniref:Homeobox-leucine zipper protein n=1 Tax=Arabis nemorensis TaxID=586526 RepID=A0A565CHR2_9BRAS|nr:unnamed protein product [Arabis nemorensis]
MMYDDEEMEWSTRSNIENMRGAFMQPPSNSLQSFNYDLYNAGNSYAATQTGPVISIPESENIIDAYQCPSNNNEMIKKKQRLTNEQLASLEQTVWFQNRRARWKVKQLEESYDLLRQDYDIVSRENQFLHNEVYKLRAIILKDHLMNRQSNLNQIAGGSQVYGNNPMLTTSTCCPPISQQPYHPW